MPNSIDIHWGTEEGGDQAAGEWDGREPQQAQQPAERDDDCWRHGQIERTGSWRPTIPTHGDPPFQLMATPRTGVATQPVEGVSGTVG